MLLDSLHLDAAAFEAGTGWAIKPEGACRGDVCVPLPVEARADGDVDVEVVAQRLGMPLVAGDGPDVWAVGPATAPTGRALTTAVAPELELPDLRTGDLFRLSSLHGQKVLLLAWASW